MFINFLMGQGGAGGSLLNVLTFGAAYQSNDPGQPASLTITFKTDRAWSMAFGAGDIPSGTPTSGTWLDAAGATADYEIKYTVTGDAASTNDAAAFTALSANRAVSWSVTATNVKSSTLVVEVRKISTPTDIVSDSFTVYVEG